MRYACLIKMSLDGFGFAVSCRVEAADIIDGLAIVRAKLQTSKTIHPSLVIREVAIVASTIVEDKTDANHD